MDCSPRREAASRAVRVPFAVADDSEALQHELLAKVDVSKVQSLQARVQEILQAKVARLADIRHVTQCARDLQKQLQVDQVERLGRVGWPQKQLAHCEYVLSLVDAWDDLLAQVHDRMKTPNSIGGPALLKQLATTWSGLVKLGVQYSEVHDRARRSAGLVSAFADRLANDARLETMSGLRRGLASVLGDQSIRHSLENLGAELPPLETRSVPRSPPPQQTRQQGRAWLHCFRVQVPASTTCSAHALRMLRACSVHAVPRSQLWSMVQCCAVHVFAGYTSNEGSGVPCAKKAGQQDFVWTGSATCFRHCLGGMEETFYKCLALGEGLQAAMIA